MISKIKTLITSLVMALALAAPVMMPSVASAVDVNSNVCSGATNLKIGGGENAAPDAGTCAADTTATKKVNDIITLVLNVFSVVVGIMAVIMIIYAGFKYITSGGKDDSVKTAKSTILYAIIGLIIVALAQIIVKFVLNKVG